MYFGLEKPEGLAKTTVEAIEDFPATRQRIDVGGVSCLYCLEGTAPRLKQLLEGIGFLK